jgi:hypothetical protein
MPACQSGAALSQRDTGTAGSLQVRLLFLLLPAAIFALEQIRGCFWATTRALPYVILLRHQFSTARSVTSALNFDQAEAVRNCYKFVPSWWMISRLFGVVFAGCWRRIQRCESSARQLMD